MYSYMKVHIYKEANENNNINSPYIKIHYMHLCNLYYHLGSHRKKESIFIPLLAANNTCVDVDELEHFMFKTAHDADFAVRTLRNETVSTKWDFSGAFSFVVTVVSTIGRYINVFNYSKNLIVTEKNNVIFL